MLAAEIISRVARIIQDDSYSDADILELINEGRWFIAANVEPGLPGLRASDTVTTSDTANYVALPDDYHKGLFWVGSAAQERRISTRASDYHNLLTYLERYPAQDITGAIDAVCVDGVNLLYQGMADDTLTLKYFRKPVDIIDKDTEEPGEIPEHLQAKLLVYYCCKEIFPELEDGADGKTPNTDKYAAKFDRAMVEMNAFAFKSHPRETKQVREVD